VWNWWNWWNWAAQKTGREEQKKQRELDLERLLQRYRNVKNELEAQQNHERIRMEKAAQLGMA